MQYLPRTRDAHAIRATCMQHTCNIHIAQGLAAELFDLGAQYQLPWLVALVQEHLLDMLSIETAASRLKLAVQYQDANGEVGELRDACMAIVTGNLAAGMRTEGWKDICLDPSVMIAILASQKGGEGGEGGARKRRKRQCMA